MADYKVTDTELTSIANAIRTKGGTQAQLEFPTGFVSAVQAIPTGGNIQPLSVTENGTYTPPSGVDGYAPVTVNVSGGGGNEMIRLQPIHSDINTGLVSGNVWYAGDSYSVCRSDVYEIEANKHYFLAFGSIVGNKTKVGCFTSDPYLVPSGGSLIGDTMPTTDLAEPYIIIGFEQFSVSGMIRSITKSGKRYLVIMKTSQNVDNIPSYLFEMNF